MSATRSEPRDYTGKAQAPVSTLYASEASKPRNRRARACPLFG
jgi:hypothetical protein